MKEQDWQLPPKPTAIVRDAMRSREERTKEFIATRDQILQRIQTLLEERGQIKGRRKIWKDNITLGSLEADVWATIEGRLDHHGQQKDCYTVTIENHGRPPRFYEKPRLMRPSFYRQLIIRRRGFMSPYRFLGKEYSYSVQEKRFPLESPATIQDNVGLQPWVNLLEYIKQRQRSIIHVPPILRTPVPCTDPIRTGTLRF